MCFCRECGTTLVHMTDSSLEMFTAHATTLVGSRNQSAYFVGVTGVAEESRMNSSHGASSFRLKLYSLETWKVRLVPSQRP